MTRQIDLAALEALPPDARRRALRALRELDEAHRSNPLWRFDPLDPMGKGVPHLKQHRWLLRGTCSVTGRRVKKRVFAGGNRAGKTTTGVVADIIDLCDEVAIPPHLRRYKGWHRPIQMFFVAVNFRAVETIAIPKFREWFPKDQLVGGRWDRAYSKDLQRLTLKNGSWLQFMTQAMDVEAFQGAALHRVHFDEEPLHDHGQRIYGECMSRLVDYNGDLLLTFTPANGMTWVYDVLYEPWEHAAGGRDEALVDLGDEGLLFLSRVGMDDNPVLDAEGKASALASYASKEEVAARKQGRFVSFSGRIYDNFSKDVHVVPDIDALEHARKAPIVRVGLDPGFRHMAGVVWVAQDHDGVWVFAEEALQETIIDGVAQQIHLRNAELEVTPDLYPADPAILKRDSQTGDTDQIAFVKAGIPVIPGQNDVRPGINRIRGLLEHRKLFVAAGCTELIREFQRYRWVQPKRTEHAARDTPVKRDDHLLDALRYAIMSLPELDKPAAPDTTPRLAKLIEQDIARTRAPEAVVTDLGSGYFA